MAEDKVTVLLEPQGHVEVRTGPRGTTVTLEGGDVASTSDGDNHEDQVRLSQERGGRIVSDNRRVAPDDKPQKEPEPEDERRRRPDVDPDRRRFPPGGGGGAGGPKAH